MMLHLLDTLSKPAGWGKDLSFNYPSPFVLSSPNQQRDASWEQLITVVSSNGEPVRQASSWDVHMQGLWHRDIFVVLHVGDQLLIQQRAAWKWTYPLLWDFAASETLEGNETFNTAAQRALSEELRGILPASGALPQAEICCGPRTYVWEGPMKHFHLRERTIVEVWRADMATLNISVDTGVRDLEVDGWRLLTLGMLREEASEHGTQRFGPWLLDSLEAIACLACWT